MSKKRNLKPIVALGAIFIVSFIVKEFGYDRENVESELDDQVPKANYSQAIELKPDDAEAYYNRGNTKSELGNLRSAIADYDRAIELKPDNAKAYNNRGFAKSDLGDHSGAIADYDRTLELSFCGPQCGGGGAIADYDRTLELRNPYARPRRDGAIAGYDRALELGIILSDAKAYNSRGLPGPSWATTAVP